MVDATRSVIRGVALGAAQAPQAAHPDAEIVASTIQGMGIGTTRRVAIFEAQ